MNNYLYIALLLLLAQLFSGCAKSYRYPNYDIIKPEITCAPNRKNIEKLLLENLNKPYIWAEEGPNAFDCSGLTYNIYGQMGVSIPRTARDQAKVGKKIEHEQLVYGDLIFFGSTNEKNKKITHVGIYLGKGWFAHASSTDRKVTYTNFADEPIYLKRTKICKRYLSEDEKKLYMNCDGKIQPMRTTTMSHTTPWKPENGIPKKAVPRY